MTYASEVAADSPVDWWRLDETTGTVMVNSVDSSRNGTVVGSPTLGVASNTGKAVQFVGTSADYISLPVGSWSTANQPYMSWECWFRMPAQDRSVEHFLFGGDTSTRATFTAIRVRTDGTIRGFIATQVGSGLGLNSPTSVDDGKWHHVVMTFQSVAKRMYLYLDGVQVASNTATGTGTPSFPTFDWRVGYDVGFAMTSIAVVDEVAVYQTELSSARVMAHYTAGSVTSASLSRVRSITAVPIVDAFPTAVLTRTRDLTATSSYKYATAVLARYRTLSATGVGVNVGEAPGAPILVTAAGTNNVLTTGWTRDSGETALGATGVGVFWFKVSAPARTTIHVTNTASASLEMFAYTVADPGQPVTTSNLSFISSGDDILVMTSEPLYIMVDVRATAGTVPFTFTLTTAPAGSIAFSVASSVGVSSTEARISVAPAALSATVSATIGTTSFAVLLDGEIIMSGIPLAADGTWSGFINIPAVDAGGYLLQVFGNGPDVLSNDIILTVERVPAAVGTLPDDAPARVPGVAVGRWSFWDPATLASYAFPMNPVSAASTNSPRNHSVESTTKPTSFVVYEGSLQAKSYTFSGVLLDEEMYQNLAAWSKLNRRIYLVDHNLVAWQVVPQHFDVRPRTNRLNPWVQDYDFTVLLLKGPSVAEVV